MFISVLDIDLFKFRTINDFLTNSFFPAEKFKQLFDDNHGQFPIPIQIEQFVLDNILQSKLKRETFRDESIIDLYVSFLNDLLHWKNYNPKQILCVLTLIQGLLCQIERTDRTNKMKLQEALVHSCSILMSGNDQKKSFLFSTHQYPKVIDYIVQNVFQHRNLYLTLLDEKPEEIEKINETRTIEFQLFEQPIFPYPLTEALPLSVYREIILQIPPTPIIHEGTDPDQISRESLSITTTSRENSNLDLNEFIENIHRQYPNVTVEQIRQLFADVSQKYLTDHNDTIQGKLREKELSLLSKFHNLNK